MSNKDRSDAIAELLKPVPDDGLAAPEVGSWAEDKHKLLAYYADVFATSMRKKWNHLVYLDLFAGSGRCRVRQATRFLRSSPTIVLGQGEFDQYILCDANGENVAALQKRVQQDHGDSNVRVFLGDANHLTETIIDALPVPRRDFRVLGFCFLDPFHLRNLKFSTIRSLSKRYLDFLILIPSGMDANRNEQHYIKPDNSVMDDFLGGSGWRSRWMEASGQRTSFEQFVVEEFGRSMKELRYIDPGLESAAAIRSDDKNLLLYRLVLYSRHKLGARFWKEVRKYTNPQLGWDF